jgi:hypothetical protein
MKRSIPYKALFLLVLLVAGAWLAQYHVANQRYYPVSKLASADGYTFYLVQERTGRRPDCGAANDRFLDRIKLTCAGCEVVYARCERELQGLELALVMGDPVPLYVVQAPGVRLAIDGPKRSLRRDCEHIAAQIVQAGVPSAACVFPGKLRTP